jgi:DNA-binding CsgD family transcriptional regulator/tetratricopeptide (TPR) repeat protein
VRAALEWGLTAEDPERGRRLAAALPWLWHLNGHGHEGIEFLRRAIGRAPADRSLLSAALLTGVALVADTASPLDVEFDAAQRALEIATENGDEGLRCLPLMLSAVGQFYTDFNAAWTLCRDAIRSAEAADDGFVIDAGRALQGIILHLRDRHDEARPLMRAAIEGLLRCGDRGVAATVIGFQAIGALYTGEPELARRIAMQAVRVAEPLGDYHRVGSTRSVLAMILGFTGDVDAGLRVMEPVLRLVEDSETEVFVPGMARAMGTLYLRRGDREAAVRWFEREARSRDRGLETYLAAQSMPGLGSALRQLNRFEEARCVLDQAVCLARRLDMPAVLAESLEQQAHLAAANDPDRAADLHHEALAMRARHGLRTFTVDSLEALASLIRRSDRLPQAVRVLAAADHARSAMGYPRPPVERPAHDETIAHLRTVLDDERFETVWTEGVCLPLDEAVAYVRRTRGARHRPATGWPSLTPTEQRIVRLAAAGLSNLQIGARLFMSRSTVKTHLAHVYAKLDVANRTELATLTAADMTTR